MSNYSKLTNFAVKDNLATGNPAKVVKGAEFDDEFNAIETAIASKLDEQIGNWTIEADGTNLVFKYSGTTKFTLAATGDITVG